MAELGITYTMRMNKGMKMPRPGLAGRGLRIAVIAAWQ